MSLTRSTPPPLLLAAVLLLFHLLAGCAPATTAESTAATQMDVAIAEDDSRWTPIQPGEHLDILPDDIHWLRTDEDGTEHIIWDEASSVVLVLRDPGGFGSPANRHAYVVNRTREARTVRYRTTVHHWTGHGLRCTIHPGPRPFRENSRRHM